MIVSKIPRSEPQMNPPLEYKSELTPVTGLYRQLQSLDCQVLLSDLYRIVIDYAVEIPDYIELKNAFKVVSYRPRLHLRGTNSIKHWRATTLHQNRQFWKNAILRTCSQCSTRLYATSGNFWCSKYHFIIGGSWEEDAHHYQMCMICSVQINPDIDDHLYNRRCRFHAVEDQLRCIQKETPRD